VNKKLEVQLKLYKQDGFVILRNCIDSTLLKNLQNYASDFLECKNSDKSIIDAMEKLEASNNPAFYEFCKRMGETPAAILIALEKNLLKFVENVLVTKKVHLVDSGVFYNKLSVKRLQYDWHQENSYFPNAKEVITIWYPWLHKVNSKNGTMVMAKGGHKIKYDSDRINVDNGLTQMKISNESLSEFEKINCDLELGDAVLFSFNSPHKTGFNSTQVPRSTIITRYTDTIGKYEGGWTPVS
jgi:ectoine hydroxylase-related dioxygenase (phytanoyl-CoA dioxygenase family)